MDLKLIILLFTSVLTALVAVIVYLGNPRGIVQRSFVALISFFVIWALFVASVYLSRDAVTATFLTRMTTMASLITAFLFWNFCVQFPVKTLNTSHITRWLFIIMVCAVPLIMLNIGAYREVLPSAEGKIFIMNPLPFAIHIASILSIFGAAYWMLFKKHKLLSGLNKRLVDIVMVAAAIPIVAGLIFNLFFLNRFRNDLYMYGPCFTIFFTLAVAYLIIRSRK